MTTNRPFKNALITASTSGLGYACAQALSTENYNITICSRKQEKVKLAIDNLQPYAKGDIKGFICDLTDQESIELLVKNSIESIGGIDVLIVSTGHPPTLPFSKASMEDWERGRKLILEPQILLSKLVLESMKQRGFGRIVFIGSIFGIEPESTSVIQSTFRTGLNALAKCIATEYAPFGITANIICPGYFDTPLLQEVARPYISEEHPTIDDVLESWKKFSPMNKFGDPKDLGQFVNYLCSDRASFISGTRFVLDGSAIKSF